jgi:hypothetical protein
MARRIAELKDQAAAERRRGHHQREAELYDAIAQLDGDPLWRHRAGEAWQHAGALREARRRYTAAAQAFAALQQHGKAIAACRMALSLSPREPVTLWIRERSERALAAPRDEALAVDEADVVAEANEETADEGTADGATDNDVTIEWCDDDSARLDARAT